MGSFGTSSPAKGSESKRLTDLLVELGSDTVLDGSGNATTRDEMLARTLWDMALGGEIENAEGETRHRKPDKQVAMFILERREGKTPNAIPDESDIQTIADKVSELGRSRLNSEAEAVVAVSEDPDAVDGPGDGPESSEGSDGEPPVEE